MDRLRKQIINDIASLDRKLQQEQLKVSQHKNQISASLGNKNFVPLAVILGILLSWRLSKSERFGNLIKRLIEVSILGIFTYFRNKIIRSLF